MKYIDIHCHVFPENIAQKAVDFLQDYYGFLWEGSGTPADLTRSSLQAGVSRSIIFSSATKPEQVPVINNYITSQVQASSGLFAGLGTIHPDFEQWEKELERIRPLGLAGIKLHPDFQHFAIDDPRMMPLYAAARELGLIFLIHLGDPVSDASSPRRLAHVMKRYPDLKVIAAHLGGYSRWDEGLKYLLDPPVYVDTSSSIAHTGIEKARELIHAYGPERVLFASDYPAVTPGTAIQELTSLQLSVEDMEKICFKNAESLFSF